MSKKISIIAAEHPYEGILLRVLLSTLITLSILYAYFVGSSVFNIIERKEASQGATELATIIADSEREYFDMAKGITSLAGESIGLSPVQSVGYVYRPGAVGSVDTRGNGL